MDIEAVVLAFVRTLVSKHQYRLPITVASVAPNGSVLFTRFTAPPVDASKGSVTLEHVTGNVEDEGFLTPFHMLATDATGRVKVGKQRKAGDPVIIEFAQDDDE